MKNMYDKHRAKDISDRSSILGNLRRAATAAFKPEERERLCAECKIDLNMEIGHTICSCGALLCRDHKHKHVR